MNVNWTGVFRVAWNTSRNVGRKLTAKPTHAPSHSDPLAPLGQLSTLAAAGLALAILAVLILTAAATLVIPNLGG